MIALLEGTIEEITNRHVTIMTSSGVGYEMLCSAACVAQLQVGEKARITVFTEVREDAINLFGFSDQLEKQVFSLLLNVQGVGPKTAAEVISNVSARMLLGAIADGNVEALRRVKGVGPKTAQRVILDLQEKVQKLSLESRDLHAQNAQYSLNDEAIAALQSLGFQRKDAEQAVQKALKNDNVSETAALVRAALRYM